jgi:hypothetical protein
VKSLEIHWPSGTVQKLEHVLSNQILTIEESDNSGAKTTN